MRRLSAALLVALLLAAAPNPAQAQGPGPAVAANPVVGPPGTVVNVTGVGFTPGGRVQVLFIAGIGVIVGDFVAGAAGTFRTSFTVPAPGQVPELTFGRQEVFAVDLATGRETLPAQFFLTPGVALDYDLPNGRFFTQANGLGGSGGSGYPVVNTQPFAQFVRFFDEFQRLGNVPLVGYPASRSFVLDGFVTQAYQKAVFQWRPEVDQVFFLNVFDLLHDRGFDPFLLAVRSVPPQLPTSFDAGKTAQQIVDDRLALLNANAAIRSVYFSVDNPLLRFGLPTSRVEDMGNHFVIRLQRAVIQQWKIAVPWAAAGQATIANGGDVFKELNQLPAFSVEPLAAPGFSRSIVVYGPTQGEVVRNPLNVTGDAQAFEAVVNFELLGERGDVLASGPLMARAGGPLFGRFEGSIPFAVGRQQTGILRLFLISARDGTPIRDSVVPVGLTLAP